jgi:hypothetical protein
VLNESPDVDELALRDVRPDADGKLRVPVQPRVRRRHEATLAGRHPASAEGHESGTVAVRPHAYDRTMNESHFAEIEKALLYISEARERAQNAARTVARDGAEEHLVEALEDADRELLALHRRLMQRTYFAVEKEQLTL